MLFLSRLVHPAAGDGVSALRARFAARFGEDLATTVEAVAEHHTKVIPGPTERGSDHSAGRSCGPSAGSA